MQRAAFQARGSVTESARSPSSISCRQAYPTRSRAAYNAQPCLWLHKDGTCFETTTAIVARKCKVCDLVTSRHRPANAARNLEIAYCQIKTIKPAPARIQTSPITRRLSG